MFFLLIVCFKSTLQLSSSKEFKIFLLNSQIYATSYNLVFNYQEVPIIFDTYRLLGGGKAGIANIFKKITLLLLPLLRLFHQRAAIQNILSLSPAKKIISACDLDLWPHHVPLLLL